MKTEFFFDVANFKHRMKCGKQANRQAEGVCGFNSFNQNLIFAQNCHLFFIFCGANQSIVEFCVRFFYV